MPLILNGSTGVLDGLMVSSANLTSDAVYLTAPAGAIAFVCQNTAPTGWIKANGATISRTAYSALFTAVGTTFGAGDGSTTFKLPDLRGYFPRGWDDAAGVDTGRSFGTSQQGTYLRTMMNDYTDSDSATTSVNFFVGMSHSNPDDVQTTGVPSPLLGGGASFGGAMYDNASTANHNNNAGFNARWIRVRPANLALLAVIKF
jgi:microcystin-dependent protein